MIEKKLTFEPGDIVIFDGEETRLGIIVWVTHKEKPACDPIVGDVPTTSCCIRELSGRQRVRSLWRDAEKGLIRKLDKFDAAYIHHLFN